MKNKKAVSPVVSTILLVMIVLIIAILIILWAKGFHKEVIEKEIDGNKKRVNEFCNEVKLKSILNVDGTFGFENIGNVPLYGFSVKMSELDSGKSKAYYFSGKNVNPGFSVMIDSSLDSSFTISYDKYEEVKVFPILLGEAKTGTKEFQCPEENALEI